ncbi:DNA repair protein RecN [Tessaracoccus rhinocerotis]|uniref:DNA repair protein RecN n=1 Tax=Tessaracoccus rhinocerotis TaxID=1689449 RepID=A0A553JW25_9ACTN|nr:DNA repair protein RecN [Tessaracoccus rhinocerotis]TRY16642.1 DNA repair protein RecN [Tessaracoccus rhinocerotis]
MLTELHLSGLGVVEDATVPLGPGLTALTGETGAGKTMIVAGLGLLLGAKADSGVVRHGNDRAVVEGRWIVGPELAQQVGELGGDVDDGEELTCRRQVGANGRSRAVVGGAQVPVSTLAATLSELATIHGQSEQIRLSSSERQREILDEYARPVGLVQYRADLAERKQLASQLARLVEEESTRTREIELLRFGLEEINAVEPVDGEDHALATEALRLQDADQLKELAATAQRALSGDEDDFDAPSAVGLLDEARKSAEQLADRDETAAELAGRIREASYTLHDIASEVASYATDLVTDPIRLEAVAERRAQLVALTRKYGPELSDVIEWARQAVTRLDELEGADESIGALRERIAELDERLTRAAEVISKDRQRAADRLAEAVRSELAALAMPHARLEFQLTRVGLGPHGWDRVELMFSANPGSTPAPLGKVASGGELSRVRLALEVILASQMGSHTYVFDEVDAGVGGAVGLEIGKRLKRLATKSQVIVVTHLAQVAAYADAHLVIAKSSDGQVTTSDIRLLDDDERGAELARMMGGSGDSEAGVEHAAELLTRARGA